MKRFLRLVVTLTFVVGSLAAASHAQDIMAGDLVLGLGRSDGLASIEFVRGSAMQNGGMMLADGWDEPFVQAMEFDNLGGISHNPQGNLLAASFGTTADGGALHSLPACETSTTDQLIGNSTGLGGDQVNLTRWGGLSVSPDNTKVALAGYDTGAVIVFDYAAGDCNGTGASTSNGRQTSDSILTQGTTQGTTWLDNDTVIAFNANGEVITVDVTSMETEVVTTVAALQEGSRYTDVEYNETISPFLYLSHSTFDGITTNKVFVVEPAAQFDDASDAIDFSESANTSREIALSAEGHLYVGQFGGDIDILLNVTDPQNVTPNSSIDWYTPATSASFSGLDVAVGLPIGGGNPGVDADFNDDGNIDGADIDQLFADIDAGTGSDTLDLNGDGAVDEADIDSWLAAAGESRGFSGPINRGDANFNGLVDASDLNVIGSGWQRTDATSWTEGDFNNDGNVNATDLNAVGANWLSDVTGGAAAAAVPEPVSSTLILMGLLALGTRRRSSSV